MPVPYCQSTGIELVQLRVRNGQGNWNRPNTVPLPGFMTFTAPDASTQKSAGWRLFVEMSYSFELTSKTRTDFVTSINSRLLNAFGGSVLTTTAGGDMNRAAYR